MRRWRETLVLLVLFPVFVLAWFRDHGLRWGEWWPQAKQAFSKRAKNVTVFRTAPFADLIIASTGLPYEARILCVGSRNRLEPQCWLTRGYRYVTGIDLLPAPGLRFGDFHRLPFTDSSFHLYYASHSLEHAIDPHRALAEATRVLKAGGYLFAAFPIGFPVSAHDRVDYQNEAGFLVHLPTNAHWQRLWGRTTPTECAVLLRLEGKEVMAGR